MALRYLGPFIVGGLLMLLVVAMIRVYEVAKLANLILEMDGTDFCIVELGIYRSTCS